MTRQTIISIESGKYDPSLGLAFKIAGLFKARIEDVFSRDEGGLLRFTACAGNDNYLNEHTDELGDCFSSTVSRSRNDEWDASVYAAPSTGKPVTAPLWGW